MKNQNNNKEIQVSTRDSGLCLTDDQERKCAAISKINLLRNFKATDQEIEDAMFSIELLFEECTDMEIFQAIKDLAIGKRQYNVNEGFRSLFMAIEINRNGNTYCED